MNNLVGIETINQTIPSPNTSSRYQLLKSTDIIDTLGQRDWTLVKTATPKVRSVNKLAFCKHIMEFEHSTISNGLDDSKLRIHVLNSHDGTSSLQIRFGVFRLVCSNGLVVAKSTLGEFRLKHYQASKSALDTLLIELLNKAPEVFKTVNTFQSIQLTDGQAFEFATQAKRLLQVIQPKQDLDASSLLKVRRTEDAGASLWQVFNRIQENSVKRGYITTNTATNKSRQAREVKSIDVLNRINTGLWSIAETFKVAA